MASADNVTPSQNTMRRQYLVTYSKANMIKFPTRESFAEAVVNSFTLSGKVVVQHWACCLEEHENTSGQHYHMCVKLSGPKRWSPVKNKLSSTYGIIVNFSENHDTYYSAYKYVTKSDAHVIHSQNHPDLQEIGSPKTKKCIKAYKSSCEKRRSYTPANKSHTPKIKKLDIIDISTFIVENNIETDEQLMAKAQEQFAEGKKDLKKFVLNKSPKALQELIETTWKLEKAASNIQRQQKPRMQIICETLDKDCIDGCDGRWLRCAIEVLQLNNVEPLEFAEAMKQLLTKGRGKNRNIFIIGPANCAKTFLLSPLESIFNAFCNPSDDKYAWLGAEKVEIIFLNDFRWSPQLIAWKELLNLLEGKIVHLPSPKNHYASDICIDKDTPIVATSKDLITFVDNNGNPDPGETYMMTIRWKVFRFHHEIAQADQIEMEPCPKCFCKLVMLGAE